jgi:hypothetical protein
MAAAKLPQRVCCGIEFDPKYININRQRGRLEQPYWHLPEDLKSLVFLDRLDELEPVTLRRFPEKSL